MIMGKVSDNRLVDESMISTPDSNRFVKKSRRKGVTINVML